MNTEELKQEIAQRTGIPAALLTGETAEENIAQAKALLAYKREHEAQRPKTAQEQFADWIGGQLDERDRQTAAAFGLQYTPRQTDPAGAALAEIEEPAAAGWDNQPCRDAISAWNMRQGAADAD